jgi:hypothetical protein
MRRQLILLKYAITAIFYNLLQSIAYKDYVENFLYHYTSSKSVKYLTLETK